MKYMIYLISFFMSLATYSAILETTEELLLKRQFSFPSEDQIKCSLRAPRFHISESQQPIPDFLAPQLAGKTLPVRSIIDITKQALTSMRKEEASSGDSLGYLPWILQVSKEKPLIEEAQEIFWSIHENWKELKKAESPRG